MGFKIRIEIEPDRDEEIIIRCHSVDERVALLQAAIENASHSDSEIELHLNGNDYFVKIQDVLFFETADNKTAAHTKARMYYTDLKLYELEEALPRCFIRISKSCIVNINRISSIKRELTGICEASFADTVKKVFVSRSYFKPFREKLNEIRLQK